MRFEEHKAEFSDGTVAEGKIAVPENLQELLRVYPEERVYKLGLAEYMIKAKKRLISKRSPVIKFHLRDLSIEQQNALRKLGLLHVG